MKHYIETFSAKGAALHFLERLFTGVQMPEKVIVGEPAVRNETWRENFRRHMREVFSELGIAQLDFFPEPFAVFQYYRHVAKAFPVAKGAEIVLIIDIGGGTFNSCIISRILALITASATLDSAGLFLTPIVVG